MLLCQCHSIAYGCTNKYRAGQTIDIFRFPLANDDLNKKWIAAIKRKQFIPTKWSRLCSDHFVNENYQVKLDNTKKVLLKEYAVPTAYDIQHECSLHFLLITKKRQVPRKKPFVRSPIQIEN